MLKKNENIVARRIHNSNFLIDITQNYLDEKSHLYEINDIGMFIWQSIDGQSDETVIAEKLMGELIGDVDYDVVYQDIVEFIGTLIDNSFIVEGSGNA